MKLIELLVQELPKRGGWPIGVTSVCQGHDGLLERLDSDGDSFEVDDIELPVLCDSTRKIANTAAECSAEIVTREQYEAALAAAQQPVWDGKGLPPVGCRVERTFNGHHFHECEIVAHSLLSSQITQAAFCDIDGGFNGWGTESAFRPIRSEADKKRAIAINAILDDMRTIPVDLDLQDEVAVIYDAIAAGKIPGVKLDV